jgi:hypothetical protein
MIGFRKLALALAAAATLAACSTAPLRPAADQPLTPEGLQPMSGGGFEETWIRPGFRAGDYRGLALESTRVSYRDAAERSRLVSTRFTDAQEAFPIPASERAHIEQRFAEEISAALDGVRTPPRAAAPGPGVLSLRAELVDFVSRVPAQEPLERNWVSSVGEATLVIELWDTERNELMLRASSRDELGPPPRQFVRGNEVTSWAETNRQMRNWSRRVAELLEQLGSMESF